LNDRPTPKTDYWGAAFAIEDADLDYLYNLLLEEETPLTSAEMAQHIIRRRHQRESEALKRREQGATPYFPRETYSVGQKVAFTVPRPGLGTVTAVRAGRNPEYGDFDVVTVDFADERGQREYAARLPQHPLNNQTLYHGEAELLSPEEIIEKNGAVIAAKLEARLKASPEIVRLAGRWFPRALLATVNIGHLNLAEAVLDMAGGGPLPTEALIKDAGLPANINPRLQAFSLHYALQEDSRFDEVGPAGEVLWYLRRLEPPEVVYPPRRLENAAPEGGPVVSELPPYLAGLIAEIDDEWSPATGEDEIERTPEVLVTLTFPHRRVGTLPLSPRLAPLFPTAYESSRVLFTWVDADTGERFPGWVVREGRYVFGLDEWFRRLDFPVGGQLTVSGGAAPGEIFIKASKRRPNREWVRMAAAAPDGRLTFTMQKHNIGIIYDDLMVVALSNPAAIDEVWLKSQSLPFPRLVADIFRELAKLNPQSAVHAKTLYAGVNVVRRCPPGPIFAQLLTRPYYAHVGDAYWRFDQSQWTE
jgi:hypothetical protein